MPKGKTSSKHKNLLSTTILFSCQHLTPTMEGRGEERRRSRGINKTNLNNFVAATRWSRRRNFWLMIMATITKWSKKCSKEMRLGKTFRQRDNKQNNVEGTKSFCEILARRQGAFSSGIFVIICISTQQTHTHSPEKLPNIPRDASSLLRLPPSAGRDELSNVTPGSAKHGMRRRLNYPRTQPKKVSSTHLHGISHSRDCISCWHIPSSIIVFIFFIIVIILVGITWQHPPSSNGGIFLRPLCHTLCYFKFSWAPHLFLRSKRRTWKVQNFLPSLVGWLSGGYSHKSHHPFCYMPMPQHNWNTTNDDSRISNHSANKKRLSG